MLPHFGQTYCFLSMIDILLSGNYSKQRLAMFASSKLTVIHHLDICNAPSSEELPQRIIRFLSTCRIRKKIEPMKCVVHFQKLHRSIRRFKSLCKYSSVITQDIVIGDDYQCGGK